MSSTIPSTFRPVLQPLPSPPMLASMSNPHQVTISRLQPARLGHFQTSRRLLQMPAALVIPERMRFLDRMAAAVFLTRRVQAFLATLEQVMELEFQGVTAVNLVAGTALADLSRVVDLLGGL